MAKKALNEVTTASVKVVEDKSKDIKKDLSQGIFDKVYNKIGHYFPDLYTVDPKIRNVIKGAIIAGIGYLVNFLLTTFVAVAAANPAITAPIVLVATLFCLYRYLIIPATIQRDIYRANIAHAEIYRKSNIDRIGLLLEELRSQKLKELKNELQERESNLVEAFYQEIGVSPDWKQHHIADLSDTIDRLEELKEANYDENFDKELSLLINLTKEYNEHEIEKDQFVEKLRDVSTIPVTEESHGHIREFNETLLLIEASLGNDHMIEDRAINSTSSSDLRIAKSLQKVLLKTDYSDARYIKHRDIIDLIFTEEQKSNLPKAFIDDIFQLTDIVSKRAKIGDGQTYLYAGGQLNTGQNALTDFKLKLREADKPAAIHSNLQKAFSTTPVYLSLEKAHLLAKTLQEVYQSSLRKGGELPRLDVSVRSTDFRPVDDDISDRPQLTNSKDPKNEYDDGYRSGPPSPSPQ